MTKYKLPEPDFCDLIDRYRTVDNNSVIIAVGSGDIEVIIIVGIGIMGQLVVSSVDATMETVTPSG